MTPWLRKAMLTAHVTSSVGWLGSVAGFLALAITGLTSSDAQLVRAVYLVMEPLTWCVIVPLSLMSLITGLVQSLGTAWGLVRHYWAVMKLVLTVAAAFFLLVHTRPIDHAAGMAARTTWSSGDLGAMRVQLVVSAGAALLVLLVTTTLSVFKPSGRTRYGRRQLTALPS